MMEHAIQQSLLSIIDDTIASARILHNLAQVIEEEELTDINTAQLRESAVRCIDVIEMIVEAATTDERYQDYRNSGIHRDLNHLRKQIMNMEEEQ